MPISKLGFKRLYRLCDYMASLPKSSAKHFAMRDFIAHEGDHQHPMPACPTVKDLHTCGTSACALGWAMTNPYFRRAGLEIDMDGRFVEVINSHDVFGLPDLWVEDDDDYDYWERLFGAGNKDKSPQAWAKRVRGLLKKWGRRTPTY